MEQVTAIHTAIFCQHPSSVLPAGDLLLILGREGLPLPVEAKGVQSTVFLAPVPLLVQQMFPHMC